MNFLYTFIYKVLNINNIHSIYINKKLVTDSCVWYRHCTFWSISADFKNSFYSQSTKPHTTYIHM